MELFGEVEVWKLREIVWWIWGEKMLFEVGLDMLGDRRNEVLVLLWWDELLDG